MGEIATRIPFSFYVRRRPLFRDVAEHGERLSQTSVADRMLAADCHRHCW